MPSNQHTDPPCPQVDGRDPRIVALVDAAQAGNAEAFGELYRIHHDAVFRFVYYRVSTEHLAEDLTSETFLRALRRIDTFAWQGRELDAWLITIARNLIYDHYKSSRVRLEIPIAEMLDLDLRQAGHEDLVVQAFYHRELMQDLDHLNDAQRECITLRFLRGLSVAETADIMGKNQGAIKTLQYRATRTLRRMLDPAMAA